MNSGTAIPEWEAGEPSAAWLEECRQWQRFPADIFVDGSWTDPSDAPLEDVMRMRTVGLGMSAVVVMPKCLLCVSQAECKCSEWKSGVKVIRIVDGAGLGITNSYGMEFLANTCGAILCADWDNRSCGEVRAGVSEKQARASGMD